MITLYQRTILLSKQQHRQSHDKPRHAKRQRRQTTKKPTNDKEAAKYFNDKAKSTNDKEAAKYLTQKSR